MYMVARAVINRRDECIAGIGRMNEYQQIENNCRQGPGGKEK
jgi:hypothetical protein